MMRALAPIKHKVLQLLTHTGFVCGCSVNKLSTSAQPHAHSFIQTGKLLMEKESRLQCAPLACISYYAKKLERSLHPV